MTSSEADLNYENLIFNPLKSNSILLENISETDLISSNDNLNAPYLLPKEASEHLKNVSENDFSVLHVNIRSVQKNFENLKFLYPS